MALVDIIIYCLLIVFVFFAVWIESKHYVCDVSHCEFFDWAENRSTNDRDKYIMQVDLQVKRSVWMRCYLLAILITAVVYWWFMAGLPPAIHFIVLLVFIFVVIYFGFAFYDHHFHGPVSTDIMDYMRHACSIDDPRKTSTTDSSNYEHTSPSHTSNNSYTSYGHESYSSSNIPEVSFSTARVDIY